MKHEDLPLRGVIVGTLVACLLIAMAPWMTGGREPLAGLLAGGALLLAALLLWRQPQARQLRFGPLSLMWGLLMLFALLSLEWTASQYATGVWVTQWLMAGLAFWVAYTLAGEGRGRVWLENGYLASAGLFSVVGLWMYLTGDYERLMSTFHWANPAAAYLLPAILLAVDRWRSLVVRGKGQNLNKKVYAWMILALILMVTFGLADSRGAALVLVLIGGLYLLAVPTPKRFWIIFVFNVLMAGALILGVAKLSTLMVHHEVKTVPGARLTEVLAGESQSASDRWLFLESGFAMWWEHPLGGVGAGAYGDVHPQYQQRVVSASADAHNLYVQVLAELGLVGAVLLAGVVWLLIWGVVRGVVLEPGALATALGAAALVVHFGLDIGARYPALLLLLAVLLGLVFRQRRDLRGEGAWWPVLVAAAVLVPTTGLYQSEVWAQRAALDQRDGDYDLAAEHYAAAQTGTLYDPDVINAEGINWYTLGTAGGADTKARLQKALDRARLAQRLDPRDAQHHQLEGRVLAAQGDLPGAVRAVRRALALDRLNHPEYALDLASWQLAQDETAAARKTAADMLALYTDKVVGNRSPESGVRPAVAGLAVLVGNVDLKAGKLDSADAMARRALRVDPESLGGRALMYQVELAQQADKSGGEQQ